MIGTSPEADLSLDDQRVMTKMKLTMPQMEAMKNFVDIDDYNNFAIILLNGNHDIHLTPDIPTIDLQENRELLDKIKAHMVDFSLITRVDQPDVNEIYMFLHPTAVAHKQSTVKISPISLNYCHALRGTGTSFDTDGKWLLGPETVGRMNDCYGKLRFVIEDILVDGVPEEMSFDIEDELDGVYECPTSEDEGANEEAQVEKSFEDSLCLSKRRMDSLLLRDFKFRRKALESDFIKRKEAIVHSMENCNKECQAEDSCPAPSVYCQLKKILPIEERRIEFLKDKKEETLSIMNDYYLSMAKSVRDVKKETEDSWLLGVPVEAVSSACGSQVQEGDTEMDGGSGSNAGVPMDVDEEVEDLKDVIPKGQIIKWQLEFYRGARANDDQAEEEGNAEYLYRSGRFFAYNKWKTLIAEHSKDKIGWQTISKPDNLWWIEYIFRPDTPHLSGLRCWIEFMAYDLLYLQKSKKPEYAKLEGKLRANKDRFMENVNRHGDSHKPHLFVAFLLKKSKAKTVEQFKKWLVDVEDEILEATDNLILLNYYSDYYGVSFRTSSQFVDLMKRIGANMGYHFARHLYSSEITLIMYELFHEGFVRFLKTENREISVLLDESTIAKVNYIMVLLQGIYKNAPKIWFYIVIHNRDGSGEGIFNAIKSQWEVDGLTTYFKQRLIGTSMDGASAMGLRGAKTKGVFKKMQNFAENPLIGTHCHAHRLNLSGKWSIKTEPFFIHMEEVIKKVSGFYNGRGYKRREHLLATSRELEVYLYDTISIHEIRWVDSDRKAAKNLKRNWVPLVTDLNKICWMTDDTVFDAPTRGQACALAHHLSTRRFVLNLQFSIDILDHLSKWSLALQKSGDTLFNKYRQRDDLLIKLDDMKCTNDCELKSFFEEVRCWGETPQFIRLVNGLPQVTTYEKTRGSKCDENQFDTAEYAEWRGFPLLPRSAGMDPDLYYSPKLSNVRNSVLERIMEQIRSYFPHESFLHSLRILDPAEIPPNPQMHYSHWQQTGSDIENIARILKFGDQEAGPFGTQADSEHFASISSEWQHLLSQFAEVPTFPQDRELSADKFWAKYLGMPGFNIYPTLRHLIEKCLSLPSGTSSVESAFSVLGRVFSKERPSLRLKVANGQMFFKLNGPKPKHYRPRKATLRWTEKHMRVDDPTRIGSPEELEQEEQEEQEEEQQNTLFEDTQFE